MQVSQILIAVIYFLNLHLCLHLKERKYVFGFIFLNFFIMSFILRSIFIIYTGDPYANTEGCDSYKYETQAMLFANESYGNFLRGILSNGSMNVDDIGYSTIVFVINNFFSDLAWTRSFVIFLNAIAITSSSYLMYRLLLNLGIEQKLALFGTCIYGFFPFFFVSSAMGLKENIFCFLIIASFYYMYRFKRKKTIVSFMASCLFISLTFFFRSVITLMLILSYIALLCSNKYNRKRIIFIATIAGGLLLCILPAVILSFTGISMELVARVTESRLARTSDSVSMQWLIQILASIIGPFPNFTRTAQYGIYHASGLLLKCFLGFFACVGVWGILRKLDYSFYPVVLYMLMGCLMLIMSGVALDMRYHVTFFFAFVVLMIKGFQMYAYKKYLYYLYIALSMSVVCFYNLR